MARVRLKDIARLAETSEATVSLVLNGRHHHRVSDALRDQILSIAAQLGYHPNRQAQLLASGRTRAVGILVNTLTNSFFSAYIGLLEDSLARHDYHVQPAETRSDPERMNVLFRWVNRRMADALISLTDVPEQGGIDADGVVYRLECFGPSDWSWLQRPRVLVDYADATRTMFQHLRAQGVRCPALLMAPQHDPRAARPTPRVRFFLERIAADLGGIIDVPSAVVAESAPFEDWYEATRRLVLSSRDIDGMFIHNAHVAPPVLRALEDCGRRVGRDIAVTTFDDPASARWLGPGLSVVREPTEAIVAELTRMVLALLDGGEPEAAETTVRATFVERASSRLG